MTPQPNFAYFALRRGVRLVGADRSRKLECGAPPGGDVSGGGARAGWPLYLLITTREDHEEAQHIPDTTSGGYGGSDYLWQGTLVYDGEVYDHIRYRARGGVWRYAMGKNMWKFDFNRGHGFQARDDYGKQYPTRVGQAELLGDHPAGELPAPRRAGAVRGRRLQAVQPGRRRKRPTPTTSTSASSRTPTRTGPTSSAATFQGLYLAVEQPDGRFLDEHGPARRQSLQDGGRHRRS